MVVVLEVGARLRGQASRSTWTSRETSAWRASMESALPVRATRVIWRRLR